MRVVELFILSEFNSLRKGKIPNELNHISHLSVNTFTCNWNLPIGIGWKVNYRTVCFKMFGTKYRPCSEGSLSERVDLGLHCLQWMAVSR